MSDMNSITKKTCCQFFSLIRDIIIAVCLTFSSQMSYAQNVNVLGSTSANGSYPTLGAAFTAINTYSSSQSGNNIVVQIANSTSESSTAAPLNAGNWTSLKIYPTTSGLSINGSVSGNGLIALNGARNVTIDGSVNQNEVLSASNNLSIINTSTSGTASTSTIRFYSSASYCSGDYVKYCNIQGSETNLSSGIIFLSTAGTSPGNSSNTITYNNITCYSTSRPVNAIYSSGSSSVTNTGNIISYNNIYNFLNVGLNSSGIYISSYSTAFTINNNNFWETTSFASTNTASYYVIRISNISGGNFTVNNNSIGGNNSGGNWTITSNYTNSFYCISISTGESVNSNVQNNTISNFNMTDNSASKFDNWYGINITQGSVNIGTSTANIIGAATGTGSITLTNAATNGIIYGIYLAGVSTDVILCENNTVASLTAANSNSFYATNLYGIYNTNPGTITISNNNIGSSTSNSLQATSQAGSNEQTVQGINSSGTGTVTISGNTITNLTDLTTTPNPSNGQINGIYCTAGNNTISSNTISYLTISNGNQAYSSTAAIIGLYFSGGGTNTVSGNIINNLSNTYTGYQGYVIGLLDDNGGNCVVSANFIYGLSISSPSSGSAYIYGILTNNSITDTYINNIISLEGTEAANIYGINDNNSTTINLYFNTVYIGGTTSGSTFSYALYNNQANTNTYINNIFYNERSSSGNDYSVLYAGAPVGVDYNDYYVSGASSAMLANVSGIDISDLNPDLQNADGGDVDSYNADPEFISGGAGVATDYKTGNPEAGQSISGITTDYLGVTRVVPTIGAFEESIINSWTGTYSSAWSYTPNWTGNSLPSTTSDVIFDASAVNNCVLDANYQIRNITNATAYLLVTNGNQLTVTGSLNLSSGAQIDASASGSTLNFMGTGPAAQTIPAGTFHSNTIYNLTINNSHGVVMTTSSTTSITNNLTITAGQFILTPGSQLTVNGTTALNGGAECLYLESGSGKRPVPSSFIDNGYSGLGSMRVDCNVYGTGSTSAPYTATGRGWYISTPVIPASNTASAILDNSPLINIWEWVEPSFDYTNISGTSTPLTNMEGYSVQSVEQMTIQFIGIPNTGAISSGSLTCTGTTNVYRGYQLFGNPYPSYLNWNDVSTTNILPIISYRTANTSGTMVFDTWNGSVGTNNNGTAAVDGLIPPTQAVWIEINSSFSSGSVTVTNACRTHDVSSANFLKSDPAQSQLNYLRIALLGNGNRDENIIMQADLSSDGLDSLNAMKMFDDIPALGEIFTYSPTGTKLVIRAVKPITEPTVFPLGCNIGLAGNYSFVADLSSLSNQDTVYLEDTLTKTIQDLRLNPQYDFTSGIASDTGRFKIHFFLKSAQGSSLLNNSLSANNNLIITANSNGINVFNCNPGSSIYLMDITGRIIYSTETFTTEAFIQNTFTDGFYVVKVSGNNNDMTKKIILIH